MSPPVAVVTGANRGIGRAIAVAFAAAGYAVLASARDPASLAPSPAALAEVASAMHYATDSLARAARTDRDTVRVAARAGRLYVTTRSLPEVKYDVRRPYANAPRDRIVDAFAVYANTADISQAALRSAADIAAAPAFQQHAALLDQFRQIRYAQRLRPTGVATIQRARGQFSVPDTPVADAGNNFRRQPQMCILGRPASGPITHCREIFASARGTASARISADS